MRKLVLDMKDRRPVWAMPDGVVQEIEAALPEDWELVVIEEHADGSGDGSARVSQEVLSAVEEAEVYCGFGVPEVLLERGTDLKWVHSGAAGVGGSLTPRMLESDVLFTPWMAKSIKTLFIPGLLPGGTGRLGKRFPPNSGGSWSG